MKSIAKRLKYTMQALFCTKKKALSLRRCGLSSAIRSSLFPSAAKKKSQNLIVSHNYGIFDSRRFAEELPEFKKSVKGCVKNESGSGYSNFEPGCVNICACTYISPEKLKID